MMHEVAESRQLALSAVVITGNEVQRIERYLASLCFDDEIMAIDSESDDETIARAGARGANPGFGKPKDFAVKRATSDRFSSLDAD